MFCWIVTYIIMLWWWVLLGYVCMMVREDYCVEIVVICEDLLVDVVEGLNCIDLENGGLNWVETKFVDLIEWMQKL